MSREFCVQFSLRLVVDYRMLWDEKVAIAKNRPPDPDNREVLIRSVWNSSRIDL